jgi:hypothetical protein
MLDLSEAQGKVALAIIVVVVLAVGYFLWAKTAPPTPAPLPGQTLQNPFGSAAPGPGGAPAASPGPMGPSPNAPFNRRR